MIKFTNEIALITAVSDLRMFLDNVKGLTAEFSSINSRSLGEKSPSGPIKIHKGLISFKSSVFKLSFDLMSANKILELLSKVFKHFAQAPLTPYARLGNPDVTQVLNWK